jgi:hypothetical protein
MPLLNPVSLRFLIFFNSSMLGENDAFHEILVALNGPGALTRTLFDPLTTMSVYALLGCFIGSSDLDSQAREATYALGREFWLLKHGA